MIKATPKIISSIQNPLVKYLVKVREESHFRKTHKSVLVTGRKLFFELSKEVLPKRVFIKQGAPLPPNIAGCEYITVTNAVLKKITNLPTPEPFAAEFPLPAPTPLAKKQRLIVVDRVRDPGNLGTLIRTALAFEWQGLFLLKGSVDLFHEKVVRASKGANFRLPYQEGELHDLLTLTQEGEHTIYAADMKGTPLSQISKSKKVLLILGNEAEGLSEECKKLGRTVCVPINKATESLNVAIAGAILMYELGS